MSSDLEQSEERGDIDESEARRDEDGRGENGPEEARRAASESDARDAETAEDLAAQVDLLAEENRRLREEYVSARLANHQRTALGLLVVGAVAILGAVAFPNSRTVLFALGGTGLFGAVLTYYLTPERFVAAGTGERIYDALGKNGERLVAELGLQAVRVYVPARSDSDGSTPSARLFVPQHSDYVVPAADQLASLFVVSDDDRARGVSLAPTGGALHREFRTAMAGDVPERPAALADQLADALVEGFELVEGARASLDPNAGRATVEVAGSAFGAVDRFDHPVASFLAVGLAAELAVPVTAEVTPEEDDSDTYLVTCEWDPDAARGQRAD